MHPDCSAPIENTRAQFIIGRDSLKQWELKHAIRELLSNTRDQAIVTANRHFEHTSGTSAPTIESHTKRSQDERTTTTVFHAGGVRLAEVKSQTKSTKWVACYEPMTATPQAGWSEECVTRVITFTNFASFIQPKHFLRGVSGAEKKQNRDCVGQFGDGMTSAFAVLTRAGANVVVRAKGYTTTAMQNLNDDFSYFQHKKNHSKSGGTPMTPKVVTEVTFNPPDERGDCAYRTFDPESFDPMSVCLDPLVDHFSLFAGEASETEGGSIPVEHSAVILQDGMRGLLYNRRFYVSTRRYFLFGYNLSDPERKMINGRDRNGMDEALLFEELKSVVCTAARKSRRVRRRIVNAYRGEDTGYYTDAQPEWFCKDIVKQLQAEARDMFPGTVMVRSHANTLMRLVAGLRGLKPVICHKFLDEEADLIESFVKDIRALPHDEIEEGGCHSATGASAGPLASQTSWACVVRNKLLDLTGAKTFAAVEFPVEWGLGSKHVVWVDKDVVLVSRGSLDVELRKEDFRTSKFLLDVISHSTNFNLAGGKVKESLRSQGTTLLDRAFEIYHTIMNTDHMPAVDHVKTVEEAAAPDGSSAAPPSGPRAAVAAAAARLTGEDTPKDGGVDSGNEATATSEQDAVAAGGADENVCSRATAATYGSAKLARRKRHLPKSGMEGTKSTSRALCESSGTSNACGDSSIAQENVASSAELKTPAGVGGHLRPSGSAGTAVTEGITEATTTTREESHAARRSTTLDGAAAKERPGRTSADAVSDGDSDGDGGGGGAHFDDRDDNDDTEGTASPMPMGQTWRRCKKRTHPNALLTPERQDEPFETLSKRQRDESQRDVGGLGGSDEGVTGTRGFIASMPAQVTPAGSYEGPPTTMSTVCVKMEEVSSSAHEGEQQASSRPRSGDGIEIQVGANGILKDQRLASGKPGETGEHLASHEPLKGCDTERARGDEKRSSRSEEGADVTRVENPPYGGEELAAFLTDSGDLIPALVHVEQYTLGRVGAIDLYRVAGRKDNGPRVCARFLEVINDRRVRSVLESAVKQNGIKVGVFCYDEGLGAASLKGRDLRAFVGEATRFKETEGEKSSGRERRPSTPRVFINLHRHCHCRCSPGNHDNGNMICSTTEESWAKEDLPTALAHEMAHIRSHTRSNIHNHQWSIEFRNWVQFN